MIRMVGAAIPSGRNARCDARAVVVANGLRHRARSQSDGVRVWLHQQIVAARTTSLSPRLRRYVDRANARGAIGPVQTWEVRPAY